MKMRAFWRMAPCSLEVDRRFRGLGVSTATIISLMMEAVTLYTTWLCIAETLIFIPYIYCITLSLTARFLFIITELESSEQEDQEVKKVEFGYVAICVAQMMRTIRNA
jgi:hypothetical protein